VVDALAIRLGLHLLTEQMLALRLSKGIPFGNAAGLVLALSFSRLAVLT